MSKAVTWQPQKNILRFLELTVVLTALLMCVSGQEGEGGGAEGYFSMHRHRATEVLLSNRPRYYDPTNFDYRPLLPPDWDAPLSRRHYGFPCRALIVDANNQDWFGNLDVIRFGINIFCAGALAVLILAASLPVFNTIAIQEKRRCDTTLALLAGLVLGSTFGFLGSMRACADYHAWHSEKALLMPDSFSQLLGLVVGGGVGIIFVLVLLRHFAGSSQLSGQ